ncbi:solute carrier family 35 member F3 isoform X3 [Halyomorpha halys]|uniref:solute carrier family 35 member F3 isoform X3 n=1 Tax=Halyomorpha halys TaxID=286706 RepID=UPI0006D4CC87
MRGEGDIPTIFNPHRVRAPPNLVVTTENNTSSGSVPNGPFTRPNQPQLQHYDSIHLVSGSQPEGADASPQRPPGNVSRLKKCTNFCCSKSAKKIYCGICVTICVTASWVGTTHCIKYMYYVPSSKSPFANLTTNSTNSKYSVTYNAPFFTTWFITNWLVLFFPIYFIFQSIISKCKQTSDLFTESIQNFRDKGFSFGRFMLRCGLFCTLWIFTKYVYINSLRILFATDVMALFATNVAFVYLLSWVILHKQFVGVRIVAVILCDTGIALLAYMDGINTSPTLNGVILSTLSAFGSAVYKVLFKRVFGEASFGQIGLFFSLIGLMNAAFFWPISLALYFTGTEVLIWEHMPWIPLLIASVLSLVANLLGNFSVAWTYDLFITLGLITAVPVSAALDVVLYGATFMDMKLAGIILISIGFFLVMFPDNWPTYITRLLRNIILLSHSTRREELPLMETAVQS